MADGPQDAPRHAGQVVRRVLLRRNIAIDAETAQIVADAVRLPDDVEQEGHAARVIEEDMGRQGRGLASR